MPNSKAIKMTDAQREAVGQVMADHFGANFQTGRYGGADDWLYIGWQLGPNYPIRCVYIDPEGTVIYDTDLIPEWRR